MDVIRQGTNLHCPKCGNDILYITKIVPITTILADHRTLRCHWPNCDWKGRYCDLVSKEAE